MSDATLKPSDLSEIEYELTNKQSHNEQLMPSVKAETYATYLRVSTDEQDVAMQQSFVERLLLTHGLKWEDAQHFKDEGVSATKYPTLESRESKKGMQGAELMELIKSGTINKLYVYRLDRLFRDGEAGFQFAKILKQYEVDLYSTDFFMNITSAEGIFQYGMQMLLAQRESGVLGERTGGGMDENRKNRIPNSKCPPYGWDFVGVGDENVNDGKGMTVPNWHEQAVMSWALEQKESNKKIAEKLNDRNLFTKKGRKFGHTTIRGWKKNPSKEQAMIGDYTNPPKKPIQYPFRPLQNKPINSNYLGGKELLWVHEDATLE